MVRNHQALVADRQLVVEVNGRDDGVGVTDVLPPASG